MTIHRRNLPPLPMRLRGRPVDHRGYPVPYFVAYFDGQPDFRVVDPEKLQNCLRHARCWICGQPLGRYGAFVVGPMCAVNRVSSEPPSHRDCAEFAVRACPFLVRPEAQRRSANMPADRKPAPGKMLEHNPGVSVLWVTRSWQLFPVDGGHLVEIGDPSEAQWFREGRTATRNEVIHAISRGFPALMEVAEDEGPEAIRELWHQLDRTRQLLPADDTQEASR